MDNGVEIALIWSYSDGLSSCKLGLGILMLCEETTTTDRMQSVRQSYELLLSIRRIAGRLVLFLRGNSVEHKRSGLFCWREVGGKFEKGTPVAASLISLLLLSLAKIQPQRNTPQTATQQQTTIQQWRK